MDVGTGGGGTGPGATALGGTALGRRIEAVRRFSRFYTRRIGVLGERMPGSDLTLAEGRVIYELAQRDGTTPTELSAELGMDPGHLSRLLGALEGKGVLDRRPSPTDGRQSLLSLTGAGRETFARMTEIAQAQVGGLLEGLSEDGQERLVSCLETAERLLGGGAGAPSPAPYLIREPRPGDIGWIIHRHGAVYAREHRFGMDFEALTAEIMAAFVRNHDPARERCWIAERDGANVGSIMLVRQDDAVAKLRVLLVEPAARGLGLGRALVAECVRFAREAGYRRITLMTDPELTSARRIYQAAGFHLAKSEPNDLFGTGRIAETWEMEL